MIEIGTMVHYLEDKNQANRYVVIANKDQELNEKFITEKPGNFTIENFTELAKNNIKPREGFHYVIQLFENINSKTFESILSGDLIHAHEFDIIRQNEMNKYLRS